MPVPQNVSITDVYMSVGVGGVTCDLSLNVSFTESLWKPMWYLTLARAWKVAVQPGCLQDIMEDLGLLVPLVIAAGDAIC